MLSGSVGAFTIAAFALGLMGVTLFVYLRSKNPAILLFILPSFFNFIFRCWLGFAYLNGFDTSPYIWMSRVIEPSYSLAGIMFLYAVYMQFNRAINGGKRIRVQS